MNTAFDISTLSTEETDQLKTLATLFCEKNKHINLSAIREMDAIWEKHIIDSLAPLKWIQEENPKTILDMGTGGGFPSLPFAIVLPQTNIFPVDSVVKKLKCVEEFAQQLSLQNIHILSGRAEELAHNRKHKAKYDMVVTRAFAHFSPMLEMTLPFLKEKGYLLSYRGPEYNREEDEMVLDHFGGFCEEILHYELSGGEKREIWKIKKVEPTLSQYPRRTGTPKKEPITFSIDT